MEDKTVGIDTVGVTRRHFIRVSAVAAGSILLKPGLLYSQSEPFRYLLTNGRAFLQGAWQSVSVGITQDGTVAVNPSSGNALETIDVADNVISPGFIDILADNSSNPRSSYSIFEKYKLLDGVTTTLQMHGGAEDAGAYYEEFGTLPHWTNYGVSTKVMLIRNRYNHMQDRYRAVERSLDGGALGVSHSIEYQYTEYSEMVEYARIAARYDRPLFLHLRYSSEERELEGVEEAIQLARDRGVRVHMDHLHSTGGTYHMAEALDLIRNARSEGFEITTCVYPYSYWATYISSRRFNDGWQERYGLTYEDLTIVGTGERVTAESFPRLRRQAGVLVAVPPGTMPLENTVNLALQEDFCMIGSDGGIEREPRANNHPRGAGAFAQAIRHAQSIGMPLETILHKMTELPRQVVRPTMENRGVLRDGAVADLTVFDPEAIEPAANVANPNQASRGISLVFVNGHLACRDRELVAQQGEAIRHSS